MNPPNNKPPGPKGVPQPFMQGKVHQFRPPVAQFKNAVAPPPYRPQPVPRVFQTKQDHLHAGVMQVRAAFKLPAAISKIGNPVVQAKQTPMVARTFPALAAVQVAHIPNPTRVPALLPGVVQLAKGPRGMKLRSGKTKALDQQPSSGFKRKRPKIAEPPEPRVTRSQVAKPAEKKKAVEAKRHVKRVQSVIPPGKGKAAEVKSRVTRLQVAKPAAKAEETKSHITRLRSAKAAEKREADEAKSSVKRVRSVIPPGKGKDAEVKSRVTRLQSVKPVAEKESKESGLSLAKAKLVTADAKYFKFGFENGANWFWVKNLTIQVSNQSAPVLVGKHSLHDRHVQGFEQFFYGGYTIVPREGSPRYSVTGGPWKPNNSEHTEPQFFAWLNQEIDDDQITAENVICVIIEINQTYTPCSRSTCRNEILSWVKTKNWGGAFCIARMSAYDLYNSSYPAVHITSMDAQRVRKADVILKLNGPAAVHQVPTKYASF